MSEDANVAGKKATEPVDTNEIVLRPADLGKADDPEETVASDVELANITVSIPDASEENEIATDRAEATSDCETAIISSGNNEDHFDANKNKNVSHVYPNNIDSTPSEPLESKPSKTTVLLDSGKKVVKLLTLCERSLFIVGLISAILLGLVPPYVIYSFGNLIEAFVIHARLTNKISTSSTNISSTYSLENITEGTSDNSSTYITSAYNGSVTLTDNITTIYDVYNDTYDFATTEGWLSTQNETLIDDVNITVFPLEDEFINITTPSTEKITFPESESTTLLPLLNITTLTEDETTQFPTTEDNFTNFQDDSRERRDVEEKEEDIAEDDNVPAEDLLLPKTSSFGLGMAILALTSFIVGFFMVLTLCMATENFMYRLRNLILQTVLHRHIYWFEQQDNKELEEFMSEGLKSFQNILGENLGIFLCCITTVIACMLEAFMYGWKLASVLFTLLPCYAGGSWLYAKLDLNHAKRQKEEYIKAEATAKSSFRSIQSIIAYGGENNEISRFCDSVRGIRKTGERRGWVMALILSGVVFFKHLAFAVAFWYGIRLATKLAASDHPAYRTKELYIVLFSSIVAAVTFAQLVPLFDAFRQALPIIQKSFDLLQMSSLIDSSSRDGLKPKSCKGSIEFSNVGFSYPSKADTTVLSGLSFRVQVGETVALVGPAKGGKSTILQLLQRFYDTASGKVSVDDHDVRQLNVGWLRSQVGLVEAEPVMFSTTIRENIRYGRQNATFEDIESAARAANAHDFIIRLPQQYDTVIGEHGTCLSHSKKQRISIARALIREPKILLLDGASSHMDIERDRVVQEALEKAISSRTAVIVPHEISSIIHVPRILVIAEGKVVEHGDHQSLLDLKGIYYHLYMEEVKNKKPEFPDWKSNVDGEEAEVASGSSSSVKSPPTQRKRIYQNVSDWMDVNKFRARQTFIRLFRSGRDYIMFSSLGVFSSIVNGLLFVIFTVIIGHYHGLLSNRNHQDVVLTAHHYAMVVFVIGVFAAFFCFMQYTMFVYYGERQTNMLRKQLFAAILHQELSWFDDPENNMKALCANLIHDPVYIRDMASSSIGQLVQTGVMATAAILIMIIYSWKIAIIAAMFSAVGMFISCLQAKVLAADSTLQSSSMDAAAKIANESIRNIKTLASLHAQNIVCTQYRAALHRIQKLSLDIYSIRGMLFGITRCAPLLLFSAVNSLGGYLIIVDLLEHSKVIVIQQLTEATFQGVTQAVGLAFNALRGLQAAHRIFQMIDHRPRIDSSINSGFMLPVRGSRSISFESVSFDYNPIKGSSRVLTGVSFEMLERELTTIVGPPGGGKSACVYLIGRLYDPKEGSVVIDHIDIQNLNVPWLRSQVAIISEEFLLGDRTITENIMYGNNTMTVRMADVIGACRSVRIHQFIQTLQKGYDTLVENERIQERSLRKLQIVAARALIRNPRIVLFDHVLPPPGSEDLENIHDLIKTLHEGRTCIITSRYVTSLPNPDHIVVLQRMVVEQGSHEQLLQQRGNYHRQWHREKLVLQSLVSSQDNVTSS